MITKAEIARVRRMLKVLKNEKDSEKRKRMTLSIDKKIKKLEEI